MTPSDTIITVLGAGYVGLTTATLLSHAGYTVYALEPNQQRLDTIRQGRSFFYEAGLDTLIASALASGNLIPTNSYAESVSKSDIVISAVGTPDNPDGSSNLSYVFAAAKETAAHLSTGAIYVQKSTVPVGTGKRIMQLFRELDTSLTYVSNPEFLREGTALTDTLYFDRIVVGGSHQPSAERITAIYRQLETQRGTIAKLAGIATEDKTGHYLATSLESAELIKITSNAFLALKISFANSIAKLSDQVGADITDVMGAVGADPRIGPDFLGAGRGYGGGCFPKDVSSLLASSLEHGVDFGIMRAVQAVNESMPGYIVEKLLDACDSNIAGKKVAILGYAFKTGTSDIRRSPGITIANMINTAGATVTVYDPQAAEEARNDFRTSVAQASSLEQAIAGSDIVVVTTGWPDILHYDLKDYADAMNGRVFVDAINAFLPAAVAAVGLSYIGVGRR